MRIEEEIKLDFNDVLIRPKRSSLNSRKEVSLLREFPVSPVVSIDGVPIIAANMDGVGTIEMARVFAQHKCFVALTKHIPLKELINFYTTEPEVTKYVFYSIGMNENDEEKFVNFRKAVGYDVTSNIKICLDVANGYTEKFSSFVKKIKDRYEPAVIMAGNVVTAEMTEQLILSGANIVKIGIGPGAVCTTRRVAGVGYPQLSAIIECADAAHGVKGMICGDGGCTVPGDFAKAFGAGADFVMAGGIFAGHIEGGGTVVNTPTGNKVQFYGMSSTTAMSLHNGGVGEYRASEGRSVMIPFKGNVEDTLKEVLGGVRSCLTYVGATKLKELPKRCTFIRVNRQLNTVFEK